MSQENVEIVRRVYERFGDGDFRATLDVADPLILLVMGRGFPDFGTYLGVDELRRYMRGFLEPWTHLTIEAEELLDAGESVVAAVCQRGTGRESGAHGELRYFVVWSFRGGKVIRLENFRDREEALEAAGLSG